MSNVNGPRNFNFDALNAKMVYGICAPKDEGVNSFNSALNAKEVYGICTPKEDSVDISSKKPENVSFFKKIGNFFHNLFKTEK